MELVGVRITNFFEDEVDVVLQVTTEAASASSTTVVSSHFPRTSVVVVDDYLLHRSEHGFRPLHLV